MLGKTFQLMTRPRKIICHDRTKLCHGTTVRVSIERQEKSVATENFYVAIITTEGLDELCRDKEIHCRDKS